MIVPKLRPEYRELAVEIIGEHSGEPAEPGLFEEIPADSTLLNDLPDICIE